MKDESLPAEGAGGGSDTNQPVGKRKPKLPYRTRWPRYEGEAKETIAVFLEVYRRHAVAGMAAAQRVVDVAPGEPGTVGQLVYWRDCVRCIDWLIGRLEYRQQHLAVLEYLAKYGELPE